MPRPLTVLLLVALAGSCLTPPAAARPLVDLDVVADHTMTRGAEAAVDVTVRLAASLSDVRPLAGARLRLELVADEERVLLADGLTGPDGRLAGPFVVPELAPGPWTLTISAEAPEGRATTGVSVDVTDATKVVLRTDRGIYRPGQAVRFSVVALNDSTGRPLGGAKASVEVTSPRGTKVWRGELETDATGMVAGELPLADDLVLGKYTLTARVGDVRVTESIDVRRPVMPAFAVDVQTEGGRATVTARYLYGEPVRGAVEVQLGGTTVKGETDEAGRFVVDLPAAPDGLSVHATVTDGAGRSESGGASLPATGGELMVALVPETSAPAAGRPFQVAAFAVEADGSLAKAHLRLLRGGKVIAKTTEPGGALVAAVEAPPAVREPAQDSEVWLQAVDIYGDLPPGDHADHGFDEHARRLHACFDAGEAGGKARMLLRNRGGTWRLAWAMLSSYGDGLDRVVTDAALRGCVKRALGGLRPGRGAGWADVTMDVGGAGAPVWLDPEPMTLKVVATTADGRTAEEELDIQAMALPGAPLVRVPQPVVAPGEPVEVRVDAGDGRPATATLLVGDVAVASAPVSGGRASLRAPMGAHGLATVRVTALPWKKDPEPVQGAASVYLAPRPLHVAIETAGRVRPGQETTVRVLVTDGEGAPVPGVGIAASVVDERILRLTAARPTLAELFRAQGLEGAELLGVEFASLLDAPPSAGRDLLRGAILWSLGAGAPMPTALSPSVDRLLEAADAILGARQALAAALAERGGAVIRDGRLAVPVAEVLAAAGWDAASLQTPFAEPVDVAWLEAIDGPLPAQALGGAVTVMRLDELDQELFGDLKLPDGEHGPLDVATLRTDEPLPPGAAVDAWGAPLWVRRAGAGCGIELVSAGPDGRLGTADDLARPSEAACGYGRMAARLSRVAYGMAGVGMAGHGVGYGGGAVQGAVGVGVSERTVAVRKRFDETVLWVAGVPTDVHGAAVLDVEMADSITGWRVAVDALSPDGRAGAGRGRIETFLPLHVDADVPPELTAGDRYTLTAVAANHSGAAADLRVRVRVEGAARLAGDGEREVHAADGATVAAPFPIEAHESGDATVTITLVGPDGPVDAVEHVLRVEPQGHLEQALVTGEAREGEGVLAMTVPMQADRASIRARLRLYRGAADQALDGLEDMLREPHGCFEQTSSTTYPNLLILQLLKEAPGADAIRTRARDLVLKGYQRLLTFEVDGGGFSWFGSAPANRVLTAYGLVEFADMAKVAPVDPALIERTRAWLVGLQQEDGSWQPDEKWLHDWSAVQGAVSTTAWITWALAEAGERGEALERGLAFLRRHQSDLRERPYLVALWAAAERAAGAEPAGPLEPLMGLAQRGDEGLRWAVGGETLLYGAGKAADVEVTAVALRALVGDPRAGADRDEARRWLWAARNPSYGWGTTQATVQTLRALALLEAERGRAPTGPAAVEVDGRAAGTLDLGVPALPTLDLDLGPGEHRVAVRTEDGALLLDLRASWRRTDAPGPLDAGLVVRLHHDGAPVQVGHTTRVEATVHNPGQDRVAMPTVVVPVPPGFRASAASLKALEAAKLVTRADDQGSEIHLYQERLDAGATVKLAWELEATAPCDVTQRGARAYAYYAPDIRGTSPNLRLVATPR